jgi:hypothetical protein
MRYHGRLAALLLVAGGASAGCASTKLRDPSMLGPTPPAIDASVIDASPICRSLAQRFIGLPALPSAASDPALRDASVGRWWVRSCSARAEGEKLAVHLAGPGWYWVDQTSSGLRVRGQVPFEATLRLRGRLHLESSSRALALWLEPSEEPDARARGPASLEVQSESALGSLLRLVPGVSPERRAAARFDEALSDAFRAQLRAGATIVVDLHSGQTDMAIGRLGPGQALSHPFSEDEAWLVNERLWLAPSATQVVGPIEPGAAHFDVIVERGPGLTYRTICERDLSAAFAALASGQLTDVPPALWTSGGTISGLGERTTRLEVLGCKYYVVSAGLGELPTLAAVRVRAGA